MLFQKYTKLNALREANLILQQEVTQLREQNEKLLDRVMSRDYSEFQASQLQQEDDQLKADTEDDPYENLEDVIPENLNG